MASAFEPPRVLGNYRVHELLGKGGMASVFRGEHTLLERPVAIKFLRREIARSAAAQQRFLREARLVAKLSHPNIVTVFDFGVLDDGTYYQASELVAGKTLGEVLRDGALEPRRALGFARQLVLGLGAAHELGIVHRDLKPANIMIVSDDRLKILDFGIAKSFDADASDSVTQVGIRIGTPGYMSPEQCLGKSEIGPATDIYSVGVALFVMLCGRKPFDAADVQDIIDAHLHEPPPRPSQFCACSPQVDELVLRCLAKDPRDRPQTTGEILEALDRELAGMPRDTAPAAAKLDDRAPITAALPRDGMRLMRLGFEATGASTTSVPTDSPTVPQPRRSSRRRIALIAAAAVALGVALAIALWPPPGTVEHLEPFRPPEPPPPSVPSVPPSPVKAPEPQPLQASEPPRTVPTVPPSPKRTRHPRVKAGSGSDTKPSDLDTAVY